VTGLISPASRLKEDQVSLPAVIRTFWFDLIPEWLVQLPPGTIIEVKEFFDVYVDIVTLAVYEANELVMQRFREDPRNPLAMPVVVLVGSWEDVNPARVQKLTDVGIYFYTVEEWRSLATR